MLYDWCAVTTAIEVNNSVQLISVPYDQRADTTKTPVARTAEEYKGTGHTSNG
jgi:hypothetical protein